ncbi:MAG: hypothetical protein ACLQCB_10355 [Spirochaetia bacterium]
MGLTDVASSGQMFRELEAQGKERIRHRIADLQQEAGRLDDTRTYGSD